MELRRRGVGNAIQIVAEDDGFTQYDYAFPTKGKRKHPVLIRPSLEQASSIDIPVATARGMGERTMGRIFRSSGHYAVYIGWGFRSEDEAEISGACRVWIDGP